MASLLLPFAPCTLFTTQWARDLSVQVNLCSVSVHDSQYLSADSGPKARPLQGCKRPLLLSEPALLLPLLPQICQAHSLLRAFALALPSAWDSLPPDVPMAPSSPPSLVCPTFTPGHFLLPIVLVTSLQSPLQHSLPSSLLCFFLEHSAPSNPHVSYPLPVSCLSAAA